MTTILDILERAVAQNASDVFIVAGLGLSFRKNGVIILEEGERLMPPDTEKLVQEIYELADNRNISRVMETGDDDFSFAVPKLSRFLKLSHEDSKSKRGNSFAINGSTRSSL